MQIGVGNAQRDALLRLDRTFAGRHGRGFAARPRHLQRDGDRVSVTSAAIQFPFADPGHRSSGRCGLVSVMNDVEQRIPGCTIRDQRIRRSCRS
jgi:hypothetical protein